MQKLLIQNPEFVFHSLEFLSDMPELIPEIIFPMRELIFHIRVIKQFLAQKQFLANPKIVPDLCFYDLTRLRHFFNFYLRSAAISSMV